MNSHLNVTTISTLVAGTVLAFYGLVFVASAVAGF